MSHDSSLRNQNRFQGKWNFYRFWYTFLIVMNGWNWSLFVFVFSMLNVWHLSTQMIKSAQVVYLIKMLHKSWLSFSNGAIVAVSSEYWNQCFGDKQPWYTYPMHLAFSDIMVLIKVLTIRLKTVLLKNFPLNLKWWRHKIVF